jgi:AraC family transcriptional regulator of adaptative response/methylated-DNA-[protein]-cysteine methyltransferase
MTTNAILTMETPREALTEVKALPSNPAKRLHEQDDSRWAAVVARDAANDGEFVFAVSSTGVYCRPSCPAKM